MGLTTEQLIQYTQAANNLAGASGQGGFLGTGISFGHSPWYNALKVGEAQNKVNQQMAQWNFENITKPVYQMEAEEWDRRFAAQNTYNSPEAQLQRMKEAGLNPALLQGETGAMEAGNPSVNEAASQFADPANLAQIRNAEAQANLADQNAIAATIDNLTRPVLNWGKIKLQNVDIQVGKANTKFTYEKTKEVKAAIKNLEANSNLLRQNLTNAQEQYKILQNEVRRTLAAAMQGEFETDMTMFNRDIMREAMQNTDEQGRGYYDPVNSFMALFWKEQRKWLIQSYIDEHNLKPYQAQALQASAYRDFTAGQVNTFEVPILKTQAKTADMWYRLNAGVYQARKENILGTLRWQNGRLQLMSFTQGIDYWTGWGQNKLHQGLDMMNTIADFNSWLPDRMMKKVGQFVGAFGGNGGSKETPAIPGNQSTGNDIWNMGNSMGYDLNYNNGW